jgi:hypothetical protein
MQRIAVALGVRLADVRAVVRIHLLAYPAVPRRWLQRDLRCCSKL